jgi:thymidylate synthase (FAD)
MGGDDRVAMSAWVSFNRDSEERLSDRNKVEGLIRFLEKNHHLTPFESTVATFRIEAPIFVFREIMRHRSASYNEWSGRYSEMIPRFYLADDDRPLVQEGKAGAYTFVPGTWEQHAYMKVRQHIAFQTAWDEYENQLEFGIAKEVARNVLPLATYLRMYMTMNARNIMHFMNLRLADNALYEIRQVAGEVEKHFAEIMPMTHAAWAGEGKICTS